MENILTYIQLVSDLAAMAAAVASLADAALRHKKEPLKRTQVQPVASRPGGTAGERSSGDDEAG
jgi:hypothetical protein